MTDPTNHRRQSSTGLQRARSVFQDADVREALARARIAADRRAPAMQDAVARSSQNWLKANGVLGALPATTGIYYLDTADRISVSPGFEFHAQNIAPWDNWAEVSLDRHAPSSGAQFDGQVSFNFSWVNPTGQMNMFDVTALYGVTANCIVTASSYWFPTWTPPASKLDAYVNLRITVDEDGHVFEPASQPDTFQDILHTLSVFGAWSVGTIAGQDVFRTYVLQYPGLLVPANGKVEFELSCGVDWFAYDGGVSFIAAGGGRRLTGWGLIIKTVPWIIT
jgi:hypothetical protein